MRLTVVPDGLLERFALTFGFVPTPLVQVSWGMGSASCIIAGIRLGIFELLEKQKKTSQEIAVATECNPSGMETLLNALNGLGYLRHKNNRYTNTKITSKWLVKSSPLSLYDSILFIGELRELFTNLEESVKTGKIADLHHSNRPPEFWEHYMRGLASMAKLPSREIARKVHFNSSPKRLLDVGGGHGVFSMAFCRRYKELQSEVLDLGDAVEYGKQIIKENGMENRVKYRAGDLREVDWGKNFDVVLIFNVIHNLTQEESQKAIIKAYTSLSSGGTLIIFDAEHKGNKGNISQTAGFSEMLCFLTSGTRAYPEMEIKEWMINAGFTSLYAQRLITFPYAFLLTGKKL